MITSIVRMKDGNSGGSAQAANTPRKALITRDDALVDGQFA